MSYWDNTLNELAERAAKGELSGSDTNEIVIALAGANNDRKTDIKEVKKSQVQQGRSIREIEEDYPLLPPEADDLSNAVRKKGVEVLGGKRSNAYKNKDLRTRTYRDIYSEVKRQYGLIDEVGRQQSYKKLKRKYLKGAFAVIDNYVCPISIQSDIDAENEIDFED